MILVIIFISIDMSLNTVFVLSDSLSFIVEVDDCKVEIHFNSSNVHGAKSVFKINRI